jgi:hypothetical protein
MVELRFFGGLSVEETAEILQVSADTIQRDWRFAKPPQIAGIEFWAHFCAQYNGCCAPGPADSGWDLKSDDAVTSSLGIFTPFEYKGQRRSPACMHIQAKQQLLSHRPLIGGFLEGKPPSALFSSINAPSEASKGHAYSQFRLSFPAVCCSSSASFFRPKARSASACLRWASGSFGS